MELAKARTMSSIQKTATATDDDSLSNSFGGDEDQDWTLIDEAASGSISPESWKLKD